ncbi:MAG: hypothetical protein KC635_10945 [Myxococcales bacterium]|nr:hypothetical protein [Myxococcales bacterium]
MPSPTPTSPLARAFAESAMPLTERGGAAVPEAIIDPRLERAALETAAGLVDLGFLGHFTAVGRHRQRFVHNMTTCQVKALTPGQGRFGLLVEQKGHVVAQLVVEAEADALRVEVMREKAEAAMAQLVKYRVADDVRFAELPGLHVLAVLGPTALDVVPEAEDLDDYAFRDVDLDGVPARVRRNPARLGIAGVDVTVAEDDAQRAYGALATRGALPCGQAALDAVRVASEWPWDGVDIGLDNLPLESARLYATVDWDKGCYIGQEVIAMTHYRGRPNKLLRRVTIAADAPDAAGATLTAGDKAVGVLGTASPVADGDARTALAVIKRKHAEAGTILGLPGGGTARVEGGLDAPSA